MKRRKLSAASGSASKTESSVGSQQLQAGKCRGKIYVKWDPKTRQSGPNTPTHTASQSPIPAVRKGEPNLGHISSMVLPSDPSHRKGDSFLPDLLHHEMPLPHPPSEQIDRNVKTLPFLVLRTWSVEISLQGNTCMFGNI